MRFTKQTFFITKQTKCFALASARLHLFPLQILQFLLTGRKNIFCPKAQGTLATPLTLRPWEKYLCIPPSTKRTMIWVLKKVFSELHTVLFSRPKCDFKKGLARVSVHFFSLRVSQRPTILPAPSAGRFLPFFN